MLRRLSENKSEKMKISIIFAIYLLYAIAILLSDWIDLFCFILKCPQASVISRVIVLIACGSITYIMRKRVIIIRERKDIVYWLGVFSILVLGIIKGGVPDTSTDVMNYHLIAQNPGFMHNFSYNIAPGDFQLFGFALPDRMFYLPRILLGYRMGTIFGSIVLIIIYTQVYEIIKNLSDEDFVICREKVSGAWKNIAWIITQEGILAFLVVMTHDVALQFGTYMVDLFGIPFALELLKILLFQDTEKKPNHAYVAFLCGMLFCMKMTNVVYVVPLLCIYLYRYRKQITIKDFVISFFTAILPVCVYLIYNMIETGNPVFPYYNKLFQSEYFPIENFKDTRWGPETIKDYLLWPIYLMFRPGYRQSEIPNKWAIGSIGIWIAVIWKMVIIVTCKNNVKRNKQYKQMAVLCLVFVISYMLWIVTTGHIRYFILGYMVGGIIFIQFVSTCFARLKYPSNIVATILLGIFAIGPVANISADLIGYEWSWRTLDKYKCNVTKVFSDYQFASIEQSEKIDAFLMNDGSKGSFAYQINKNVPIIFNNYVHNRLANKQQEIALKKIDTMFDEGLNIYDMFYAAEGDFETHIEKLNEYGLKLMNLEWLNGHLIDSNNLVLMKLGKGQNTYCYASALNQEELYIEPQTSRIEVEFCGGLINNFGCFQQAIDNAQLQVIISDGSAVIKQDTIKIEEEEFYKLKYALDLKEKHTLKIEFKITDGNGVEQESIEPYHFAIVSTNTENCSVHS